MYSKSVYFLFNFNRTKFFFNQQKIAYLLFEITYGMTKLKYMVI